MDAQVAQDIFKEDTWLPAIYLARSLTRRNTLIMPEDESSIQIIDIGMSVTEHKEVYQDLPKVTVGSESEKVGWTHVLVIGDFDSAGGRKLLHKAIQARIEDPNIELVLLHNQQESTNAPTLSTVLRTLQAMDYLDSPAKLEGLLEATPSPDPQGDEAARSSEFWSSAQIFAKALGFNAGQKGLVVNGRVIGPIPESLDFSNDDFKLLLKYEHEKRTAPALGAAHALGILDKLDSPLAAARLSSLVALSAVSDVPEGIFEAPSTLRTSAFKQWNTNAAIQTGDIDTAIIQIVAIVDPASELAQRWIPVLKVLSELSGVHLRLFMNPQDVLEELPVKRFYRYVLDVRPTFESDGSLMKPRARFTGIPGEALLTVGMDVPPSWLVAPKECIYDLDNIKLSSLKDRLRGSDVNAVYELEHILIEGHSRDISTGKAPRGVQLTLGTEKTPHHADTIVMANLGYFQFKANPGYWKINLEKGRSQKIFHIDSAGTKGYRPTPGDESTEIELMSFQGKTLFPRLSRKPGRENDDVLEEEKPKPGSAMGYFSKGLKVVEDVLSNVGLAKSKQHADINIFSVASGHLYERMLNIMMVSVMRHTKHTVKFWFIEQFLSPSFKVGRLFSSRRAFPSK
jgi:UDP-glucose:glycoprotein glucosyltransferase